MTSLIEYFNILKKEKISVFKLKILLTLFTIAIIFPSCSNTVSNPNYPQTGIKVNYLSTVTTNQFSSLKMAIRPFFYYTYVTDDDTPRLGYFTTSGFGLDSARDILPYTNTNSGFVSTGSGTLMLESKIDKIILAIVNAELKYTIAGTNYTTNFAFGQYYWFTNVFTNSINSTTNFEMFFTLDVDSSFILVETNKFMFFPQCSILSIAH